MHLASRQSGASQEASEGECGENVACVPFLPFFFCLGWGVWVGRRVGLLAEGSPDKAGLLEFTGFLSHCVVPSLNSQSNKAFPPHQRKKGLFPLVSQFGREIGRSWGHH